MRKATENVRTFKNRRENVLKKLGNNALVVASHPEHIRNHDVGYAYRQDSNLYYLTGFEEPESVLILRPGNFPESILFVREKNIERETWDGFRFGPEAAQQEFQVDKCFPIEEFEKQAVELLKGYEGVYYRLLKNPTFDQKFLSVLEELRRVQGRTGYGLMTIQDADVFLGEMRLKKTGEELVNLRRACEISANGHIEAMKYTKPGVTERQIQGVMTNYFLSQNSAREGYNFIVASGNSATTLHYNFNDQVCKDGELLLIDAGAEFNYYTGDITRCFPVNGKFSKAQVDIYQGVLNIQKEIIAGLKPGIFFKDLHEQGASMLTDLMLELGLLSGRKQDIMAANAHRKYYPHGIGHWLGMDVHDAGLYFIKGEPRAIEEGMCFTVEPGLYVPGNDTQAPAQYRGIGVRIEDNIVINASGCENMTSDVPKEIADIEALMKG